MTRSVRRVWMGGLLVVGGGCVAGCHVISPEHLKGPAKPLNELVAKPVSRELDLPPEDDALTLAADSLEKGNTAEAAAHLAKHVKQHPDQVIFRNQLAEQLYKLDRLTESQYHFNLVDSASTNLGNKLISQRIHCHTRLMEIARDRDDAFAEHLHRGIGLYLIADEVQAKADDPMELTADAERLWCRAANELKEATKLEPEHARAYWYLYLVWAKLDQPRPAEAALKSTSERVVLSPLPMAEDLEFRQTFAQQRRGSR